MVTTRVAMNRGAMKRMKRVAVLVLVKRDLLVCLFGLKQMGFDSQLGAGFFLRFAGLFLYVVLDSLPETHV